MDDTGFDQPSGVRDDGHGRAHRARPVFLCAARHRADAGREPAGRADLGDLSGCLARAGRKRPGQADRKRGQHGGGRQADPVALGGRPVADLGRVPLRSRHEPGDPGSARQARADPRRIPARGEGPGRDARRRRERPAGRVVRADRQGQFAARTDAAGRAGRAERLRAGQGCRSRRPRRQRDAPDPGPRRPGQADRVRPVG